MRAPLPPLPTPLPCRPKTPLCAVRALPHARVHPAERAHATVGYFHALCHALCRHHCHALCRHRYSDALSRHHCHALCHALSWHDGHALCHALSRHRVQRSISRRAAQLRLLSGLANAPSDVEAPHTPLHPPPASAEGPAAAPKFDRETAISEGGAGAAADRAVDLRRYAATQRDAQRETAALSRARIAARTSHRCLSENEKLIRSLMRAKYHCTGCAACARGVATARRGGWC